MTDSLDDLRQRAEAEGQGHLFRAWDRLAPDRRQHLLGQVAALDWALLRSQAALLEAEAPRPAERFEPPAVFPLERDAAQTERAREARAAGVAELEAGRVGYVLVAGGQGSRLGFDGPKGAYRVGPVRDTSLFAWHAARLAACAARHGVRVPWYVMTSSANDADTRALFEREGHYGLEPADVRFFVQDMLPALDPEGRVVMSAPDQLFLAPNGHGGTLDALARSGCLADARVRGLTTLSYFQVDNPLARPADPLFLGLHALEGAEMSSKVVAKRDAGEKVGVLGLADGVLGCIEYSDLPADLRDARAEDGGLLFRAGNIAAHLFSVDFLQRLTTGPLDLPWHLARKRMRGLGPDGEPTELEGVKFETFVFDALGRAESSVTLEVDRALEFSPVKNAEGADSPASCRRDLGRLFAGWVAAAGLPAPPVDADGAPRVEVDPRVAEDEAEFLARQPLTPTAVGEGQVFAPGAP